jgi:hypothetical protein
LLSDIDLSSVERRNHYVSRSVKLSAWWGHQSLRVLTTSERGGAEPSYPPAIIGAGKTEEGSMNGLIYLVGLVVVVLAVLSFFGLR